MVWPTQRENIPGVKPCSGRLVPTGGVNLKDLPSSPSSESTRGLNESFPLNAMAVTTVGEARKFI